MTDPTTIDRLPKKYIEDTKSGAYFGSKNIKQKYVVRMKAHIAADQLVHGSYWENCKGCAIGCVVEKASDPHEQMQRELNVPMPVIYLYEKIFESLTGPRDMQFPLQVLQAITEGSDLSLVAPRLMHWLLTDERRGVLSHVEAWRKYDTKDEYTTKVIEAVKQVAGVIKKWVETGRLDESAARSARSAAESVEWSVAKWSAARSAAEWSVASAESAESAALVNPVASADLAVSAESVALAVPAELAEALHSRKPARHGSTIHNTDKVSPIATMRQLRSSIVAPRTMLRHAILSAAEVISAAGVDSATVAAVETR